MSSASANLDDNLQLNDGNDSEEDAPKRVKRRIQQFSDSDSDKEVTQNRSDKLGSQEESKLQDSNNDSEDDAVITIHKKSRIRKSNNKSSSDSEASNEDGKSVSKEKPEGSPDSGSDDDEAIFKSIPQKPKKQEASSESSDSDTVKYGQHMRMKNKRNKMKDKFKNLLSSRGKEKPSDITEKELTSMNSSNSDDDEVASIEKIKQKIKERMSYKPSICDPDTSDEEAGSRHKSMPKQKKEKRTKMISPKPQRMSAKQAMENMQKIRSESNRMLREKDVSLPYHRPKALSLKDIMSRRKPAMSSDGKCLPIKMNGDQLKQYAQMLEDRQKQMMELWQSDSDGENEKQSDDEKHVETDDKKLEEATNTDEQKLETAVSVNEDAKEVTILAEADISAANDELFDVLSRSIIVETPNDSKEKENLLESINEQVTEEQDSESNMKLVFNESETSITEEKQDTNNIAEDSVVVINIEVNSLIESDKNNEHQVLDSAKLNTESDSQLVSLHYDSEKLDTATKTTEVQPEISPSKVVDSGKTLLTGDETENINKEIEEMNVDGFSDDDMNIEDIDNIIENAEVIRDIEDKVNSQVLIRDRPLNFNPKLTGSPGMVIDLDDSETLPKKSGVELLKERFTFFAKLKTPEEMERAKERQIKPGNQHLRLKQELEQQMADQRSLEWTKRLEDEKQQQKELKELRGEESDDDNDIDKIEAKLGDENIENEPETSESEEEELLENDIEMKDKPRAKNPMLENEADESDCEENEARGQVLEDEDENEENAEVNDGDDEDAESSEDSESSESEEEQTSTKKGRILKAFEDSDDEDATKETDTKTEAKPGCEDLQGSQLTSQDDVLTLAQRHKSVSEDLFTSQGSSLLVYQIAKSPTVPESLENDVDLGTQTFSILDSTKNTSDFLNPASLGSSDKINDICGTQTYVDNLDAAMCSGSFSQGLPPLPISQVSQSQAIGEDILALCTGKFYDNEFVSQVVENQTPLGASQEFDGLNESPVQMSHRDETQEMPKDIMESQTEDNDKENIINEETVSNMEVNNTVNQTKIIDDNLKSILDELDDPEFELPKPNKFFCGATQKQMETEKEQAVIKKKLVIDSDDENEADASETKKRKKIKKKKPEMRALQISDDEEDEVSELEEYESEIEEENEERLVEYDSEENEIEVKPQNQNQQPSKKKRKGTEFFEQEAELTSEDEWAGSGDEDEAGLDRMEREAGDDESFHQGRLQRELGQIHMREVIDQDKREVRIIQELLFEDGDLGAGGRQRKFKWKNLDGDEETGTGNDEFKDTQEEEFESEEQWRKQRHERETFLKQMQNNGELDDSLNVSINRTTIIKANLMSKTMSTLLAENQPPTKKDVPVETERKNKDIPSPKKPFSILQQSYQGSILNRGRGALARLAALATPLASDDDAPKGKSAVNSARNFVFATLTPEAPKVSKRKADANPSTPALVKKMKTEEKQNMAKSRLLEYMKV